LLVEVFQGYDGKLLVAKIRGLMPGGTVLHCRRGAGDDKPDGLAT
jgi:hypothetical protein